MGRRSASPQPRRRGSRSASASRSRSRSPSRSPSANRSKPKAVNKRAASRSRSASPSRSKSRSPSRSKDRTGRKGDGGRRRSRSRERNDRRRDDRRGNGRDHGDRRRRSNSRSRSGSRGRRDGGRDGGRDGNRGRPEPQSLLVRNLDPSTTEADLRRVFSRNEGEVRDVYIPKEFGGSQPRGFAFIEFNDRNVARERKYEMDRTELHGREIAVLFAQQRRKTPDQMRELMPMGQSYRGRSDSRDQRDDRGRDNDSRRSPIRD